MRILVTGITGFIGKALAERLAKLGYQVFGLVRPLSTSRDVPEGVAVVSGDLTDYYSVERAVREIRPEVVVHLGALTPVSESFKMPIAYLETNFLGTVHLCEALLKHARESLRMFIFAGTTEMFDTTERITPKTPFSPTSPYSVSKISAYYYLVYLYKTFNFPFVVAVPTNTYGRANVRQRHFVIEKIITEMLLGKKKILMGRPDAIRDFMFREDHVDAYVRIIEAVQDSNRYEQILGKMYTFGTGIGYRIDQVFEMIRRLIGWDGEVVWNVYIRPNEPRVIVVDYSEAERDLNWRPRYSLEEGLKVAIREWREVLRV